MSPEEIVQEICAACESMAGLPYDGEPVDQLQHALQTAALAVASGADDVTVVAALLHDVARAPAVAGMMRDGERSHHGALGSAWLRPRVGPRAAWLAEQHVAAKRYLVATEPEYRAGLSPTSLTTLAAQGGPMSDAEGAAAEQHADWPAAVALRRWDDTAKVPAKPVASLASYRPLLERVVRAAAAPQ